METTLCGDGLLKGYNQFCCPNCILLSTLKQKPYFDMYNVVVECFIAIVQLYFCKYIQKEYLCYLGSIIHYFANNLFYHEQLQNCKIEGVFADYS